MKTFLVVTASALVMMGCLFSSCNKEDDSVSSTPTTPVIKSTEVFVVEPSGNYTDDADAIQLALNNAVTAGPGSTVQLTAGTFYLDTRIEVDGFDGYFKGAGTQNTIITTYGQINLGLANDDIPSLIKFRHGNLKLSDMTIQITLPEPATGLLNNDWFENAIPFLLVVTGNPSDVPTTEDVIGGASFDKVNFIGGQGNLFDEYNVSTFIVIGAEGYSDYYYTLSDGIYNFTDCEFHHAERGIICYGPDSNDTWTIGGAANNSNLFEDMNHGVILLDFDDSFLEVSHNEFAHMKRSAIMVAQEYFLTDLSLTTCLIHANDIQIEGIADGISIGDYSVAFGGPKLLNATITNNNIMLDNSEWGGIFGEGCQDVAITNNKIWGAGLFGIYAGSSGYDATGWTLIGNNLQQLNAVVTPIYLGLHSSNFVVTGGSNHTNVWDRGTNNILTGVNNMQGNIGPELQTALEMKHQIMMESLHH